jgi:hypothetical protein
LRQETLPSLFLAVPRPRPGNRRADRPELCASVFRSEWPLQAGGADMPPPEREYYFCNLSAVKKKTLCTIEKFYLIGGAAMVLTFLIKGPECNGQRSWNPPREMSFFVYRLNKNYYHFK